MRTFFLFGINRLPSVGPGTAGGPIPDSPAGPAHRGNRRRDQAIRRGAQAIYRKGPADLSGRQERYLAFSVTTKIYDETGRFEGVFIEVKEIKDGFIKGVNANDINVVTKYKLGDAYTFAEKDVLDWTISHPDGTEEGNFVGKYIESLQKPQPTP